MARSTAAGRAAIAVVRLSGPDAIALVDRCVRTSRPLAGASGHTLTHGVLEAADGAPIDEVVVGLYRAPRSYTGEDVVEVSCHGSPVLTREILARFRELGARPAGPGEFTRRAFLNGKLNLAEAEAVCRLIEARGAAAARGAAVQLTGGVGARVVSLRREILETLGLVEAEVDFPDQDLTPTDAGRLRERLDDHARDAERLHREASRLRAVEGVPRVVLVGAPNAGKSSLFNALVGRQRAIVHEMPGTTRDVVDAEVTLGDAATGEVTLHLTDTAGLREVAGADPVDPVEAEGVRRSREATDGADRLLVVADGSTDSVPAETRELLAGTPRERAIVVLSKSDLPARLSADTLAEWEPRRVSAVTGEGIDGLVEMLTRIVSGETGPPAVARAEGSELEAATGGRARIDDALHESAVSAGRAVAAFAETGALEICAEELRRAADALGVVTGERAGPELLDVIFSRFCIGK